MDTCALGAEDGAGPGMPPREGHAAARLKAKRAALRSVQRRSRIVAQCHVPEDSGHASLALEKPPQQPRSALWAESGGWHVVVELPGVPPEAVALTVHAGALLIHACGFFRYEAHIPLPSTADPHSWRWHCAHGLLQGHLASHGAQEEA